MTTHRARRVRLTTPPGTSRPTVDYGAKDIQVLEGLDPVRKRPGMYIGSTGLAGPAPPDLGGRRQRRRRGDGRLLHAHRRHAARRRRLPRRRQRPRHPGRRAPGQYKGKSAAEIVLTVLHAGGKFGGGGYKVSGGLHGVGVSVVNALSERLIVEVDRDGKRYRQEYAKGGKPQGKMEVVGDTPARGRQHRHRPSRSGPTRRLRAEGTEFVARTVLERLQTMAFLNRGLEIVFTDERPEKEQQVTFQYKGGLVDFVKHLNASKEPLFPRSATSRTSDEDSQTLDVAHPVEHRLLRGHPRLRQRHLHHRGRHARRGLPHRARPRSSTSTPRAKNLLKEKDDNLLGEDIREGLTAIISVKLRDPQFEGQTKAKLGNVPMRSFVQKATNERLAEWLEENPAEANKVVKKALAAAQARVAAKNARNAIRRKTALSGAGMPDKLKDCSSRNAERERAVHRRGRLRRRHRRRRAATRGPRRSCRSAARSSTSSGPASTRC